MEFPDRKDLSRKEYLKSIGLYFDDNKSEVIDDDGFNRNVSSEITEKSKSYSWSRLFLSSEYDLEEGDIITITYLLTNESMDVIFATYDKKNSIKDLSELNIIDYDPEEDKKVLCLMVDIDEVNTNNDIPFLRTLFKSGKWYDHQLLRRSDLKFECKEKGIIFDYYSVNF